LFRNCRFIIPQSQKLKGQKFLKGLAGRLFVIPFDNNLKIVPNFGGHTMNTTLQFVSGHVGDNRCFHNAAYFELPIVKEKVKNSIDTLLSASTQVTACRIILNESRLESRRALHTFLRYN